MTIYEKLDELAGGAALGDKGAESISVAEFTRWHAVGVRVVDLLEVLPELRRALAPR